MNINEFGLKTANIAAAESATLNVKEAVTPVLCFIEEAVSKGHFSVTVEADLMDKTIIMGPGAGETISVVTLLRGLCYKVVPQRQVEVQKDAYIISWEL